LQKQSDTSYRRQGPTQKRKAEQESTRIQSAIAITLFFGFSNGLSITIMAIMAPSDAHAAKADLKDLMDYEKEYFYKSLLTLFGMDGTAMASMVG
jgi:hypothetical protein